MEQEQGKDVKAVTKPQESREKCKKGQAEKQRRPVDEESILQGLAKIAFADDESVKTSERLRALELLGRHLGMFDGGAQQWSGFKI